MGNINSNMTEQTNHGKLHLFIGPMYSGKTSKLIEVYEDCIEKSIDFLLVCSYCNTVRILAKNQFIFH